VLLSRGRTDCLDDVIQYERMARVVGVSSSRQPIGAVHSTETVIADAAITVIAREGLDALSIRQVAAEAGVSIGAVQHHFRSRAELVLEVLNRSVERQAARVLAAPKAATIIGSLSSRLARLLPKDNSSREDAIVWVAMAAAAARDPLIGPRQREVVAMSVKAIEATLRHAQHVGEISAQLDIRQTALMIEASVDGFILHAAASGRIVKHDTISRFEASVRLLTQPDHLEPVPIALPERRSRVERSGQR
jgi:AcrR family transcriptional regulator